MKKAMTSTPFSGPRQQPDRQRDAAADPWSDDRQRLDQAGNYSQQGRVGHAKQEEAKSRQHADDQHVDDHATEVATQLHAELAEGRPQLVFCVGRQ